MISRVYRPFKPYTTRIGVHSHIKEMYQRVKPSEKVRVYNRDELYNHAYSNYTYSKPENVEIGDINNVISDSSDYELVETVDQRHQFSQPTVTIIDSGQVLDNSGFCTTSDYSIILDAANSRESRVREYYQDNIYQCLNLLINQMNIGLESSGSESIDVAVPLIRNPRSDGTRRDNYSHWIQGYLTRLEGLEYYKNLSEDQPKIIIEQDPPSWVSESLELMGYHDNVVFWDPKRRINVKKMIIPSVRRREEWQGRNGINYKVPSKLACQWLREKSISCADISKFEFSNKIFISRDDAERRRLQNRNELMETLDQKGFESYKLSDLSFEEQVAMFAQADEVVGVHGAGLTNIMFATDCRVTEIVGGSYKPTYYILSEILNLDYRVISGKSVQEPNVMTHHQDVLLNKHPSICFENY